MNIRFTCPLCECPGRLDLPGRTEWQCPACDHLVVVPAPFDPALPACAICECHDLYKKKNFPHKLGMGILVVAALTSSLSTLFYQWYWTWGILIGSAAFDGILYLLVKDAVVCYRCEAHYRGVSAQVHHEPFELTIHERYRQEKLRREQLQARNPTSELRIPKQMQ